MRFDRAMSDAESLMWRLEKDPYLSSTFGAAMLLDRAPDVAAMKRRLTRTSHVIPRLHQHVAPAPGGVAPPLWVDDPDFDIDYHVRRIACPKPGHLRDALDLAVQVVGDPFDRTRPLWQYVVIEGLRGGKSIVLQKMHHTLTDGERGVELSMQYLDFERDAAEPPDLDGDAATPADEPAEPGPLDAARDFVAGGLRLPIGVAREVRHLLAEPTAIPDATTAAVRTIKAIAAQLGDTAAARSPLWTQRSLHRGFETLRVPFRSTKDASARLGGTINTAFLTAAAHAAGRYHDELGEPVGELRASMAVSTRTEESGSNAFSLVKLTVPTEAMPIGDRFRLVETAIGEARSMSPTAGLDALAALTVALPTSLLTRIARQQTQTVDFATSNLRGSPIPMFLAGAQILAVYPIGPLLGVAFNATLMSYLGDLDIGVTIDTAAISEPELLGQCLTEAFRELARAR